MPKHTPAKRAINRKRAAAQQKALKEIRAAKAAAGIKPKRRKKKTISGLARNAAARPGARSRREPRTDFNLE
jgi:hypothetical protein